MPGTVLLTGATGTLGSQLLRRLLDAGERVVCVVRGRDQAEAERRIRRIVAPSSRLQILCGDIKQRHCGLSPRDTERLRGRIDTVVHCAASIDFHDAEAATATNVEGVRHMLELADELQRTGHPGQQAGRFPRRARARRPPVGPVEGQELHPGRAGLRRALYMPALVAIRCNAPLQAEYEQLITAGKPAKLALTAAMRKLLVLANALLRDGRTWAPESPRPRRIL